MNSLPKFIFTRTGKVTPWANVTVVQSDAVREIRTLKQQGDRLSFVFGSAGFCRTLIENDLFDEYRVMIAPIILGNGKPLFGSGLPRHSLKLLEARTMTSGGLLLRYKPVQND
jgi:dihydrofolate reductase